MSVGLRISTVLSFTPRLQHSVGSHDYWCQGCLWWQRHNRKPEHCRLSSWILQRIHILYCTRNAPSSMDNGLPVQYTIFNIGFWVDSDGNVKGGVLLEVIWQIGGATNSYQLCLETNNLIAFPYEGSICWHYWVESVAHQFPKRPSSTHLLKPQ